MNIGKYSYYISGLLVAVGIAGFASADASPTKGRIPEEAFSNNSVQLDRVPDYIPAFAQNGEVAGYVRKVDLFGKSRAHAEPIVVVDESLTRPVGRMVPGRGFVANGVLEESLPLIEVQVHEESVQGRAK